MLSKLLSSLTAEVNSYTRYEKFFIICMMICSFSITAEAAITRAVSSSVFLSAYSAKFLPWVWLASVPINFGIVVFYNRFLPRLGCAKMLGLTILIATAINIFAAFYLQKFHFLPFLLYVWKDIFVILMFQQMWSVIHATVNISKAKYLYGIFFGAGGLGSVTGSMVPGFMAVWLGSEHLLLTTIPFYIVVTFFYFIALNSREKIPTRQNISTLSSDSTDILGGMKLIRHSKFLIFILLIVMGMQISSTIVDYQFSTYLEQTFAVQDLRTQFLGRFFGFVNSLNIFLQFIGSFVLVHLFGLQASHLLVPLILGCNALGFFFFPSFQVMCFSFGSIKALDYSIFGIIKEMLYIPLKVAEKFKAKAIIDVFAYRSSKACASLFILALQFIPFISLTTLLTGGLITIFFGWMLAILFMFKYYYQELDRQHLNWPESQVIAESIVDIVKPNS